MAGFDIQTFFREQNERMNTPDEELHAYLARMAGITTLSKAPIHPSTSLPARSEEDEPAGLEQLSTPKLRSPPPNAQAVLTEQVLESDVNASLKRKAGAIDAPPQNSRSKRPRNNFMADAHSNSGNVEPTGGAPVNSIHQHIEPLISGSIHIARPFQKTVVDLTKWDNVRNLHPQRATNQKATSTDFPVESQSVSAPRDLKHGDLPVPAPSGDVQQSGTFPLAPKDDHSNALRSTGPTSVPNMKGPSPPSPPTSPIESANETSPLNLRSAAASHTGKTAIEPAPTDQLYLEIRQRVASHPAGRKQNKVVRPVNEDKPGQPSKPPRYTIPVDVEDSVIYVSSSESEAQRSSPVKAEKKKKSTTVTADSTSMTKEKRKQAKVKEKLPMMSPTAYARYVLETALSSEPSAKKSKIFKFLAGMNIFYTGGDMSFASARTRGRMEIIVKYGGNLLPIYDASIVTHIVTDAAIRPTLRAMGLKRLGEIPENVPTVRWSWIVSGIGRNPTLVKGLPEQRMEEVWMHAAFSERIDAGVAIRKPSASKGKGKAKMTAPKELVSQFAPNADDISHISDFTPEKQKDGDFRPPLPSRREEPKNAHPSASTPVVSQDPLAAFYVQARAEKEGSWSRYGEADGSEPAESDAAESESEEVPAPGPIAKRGFTCDNKEKQRQKCVNQDIVDKLQELMSLHKSKLGDEDHWRAFTYSKCIRALRNHPTRIKSFSEARSIRGVGEKTAAKIMEIIGTGELRRIGYERTDDVKVTRVFQGIYGVGQSTAYKWYASGCRTLEDIARGKGGVQLTPAQEIGVRFYDDINDRMPRQEAKAIFNRIKPIALSIDPKLYIEIMGSYRRGKADCGDIDIIITRPTDDGKTHGGVLSRLLRKLHEEGIITEDLAVPEFPDDLEAIYRGLCRLPQPGSRRRRIDFLATPWESRGAALLYYTGDDIFNRAMRLKANVLGYSLNQRGLFSGVIRDPRDRRVKMNEGTMLASETEQEIFRILGVPWQEPHERVRG